MVGVVQEFRGDELQQFLFHFEHVLARCQSGAVGDAEDMRVDGDGRLAEGGVENDIGGLAADTGQGFKRGAVFRNFAAVLFTRMAQVLRMFSALVLNRPMVLM